MPNGPEKISGPFDVVSYKPQSAFAEIPAGPFISPQSISG
ncbi:hypothetical protein ANACOL_00010 [Anaerotruncus colihominis DSM 17241]|uniref:Uncharacterized protein n=1 Tax=Anaerotruncus colihominis DSM 17241 TaxID=445972 RepID=B0P5I9_9FIRM|nr:hypothetical protein ANACOL_00010 [Anaerotruncus colihominis DSM 17241]